MCMCKIYTHTCMHAYICLHMSVAKHILKILHTSTCKVSVRTHACSCLMFPTFFQIPHLFADTQTKSSQAMDPTTV